MSDEEASEVEDVDDASDDSVAPEDKRKRWRLVLGVDDEQQSIALNGTERRIDRALGALYGDSGGKTGGMGRSAPRIAKWLGDIREFFPSPVVQVIQRDALTRLGLDAMLLEPELLETIEADVHLVATLVSMRGAMPEKTRATARAVVQKVVDELMKKLEAKTVQALRGALNRARRTRRPRFNDIDWARTIGANLRHYQPEHKTIVPETMLGFGRHRRQAELERVILCVDQSGSMAESVVYSSIFAAVMASIPSLETQLVVFDTEIVDMTEDLADPVEVLFGIQLGGGTDINRALAHCQSLVRQPSKTHLILISDLMEGGNEQEMRRRAAKIVGDGINLVCLLALSDEGQPYADQGNAQFMASLGAPVFACTPDRFPDLMAAALQRADLHAWAAERDIKLSHNAAE